MSVAVERVSHYRLVARLGKGAMGEVYRAVDERLGRHVALKLLPHARAGHTGWQARLLREAQAASALNHPGIVTLHDVGQWQGRVFLVMELVEGDNLADLAHRGISVDDALRLIDDVAAALGAAHARGILHRDIKSANLMVTADGRVKVLDFGLAKLHDAREGTPDPSAASSSGGMRAVTPAPIAHHHAVAETLLPGDSVDATVAGGADTSAPSSRSGGHSLTAAGDLVGTPAYMAPEVARGIEPDPRSEVWSLGVVLFELLTGQRPFDRGDVDKTLDAVREGKAPAPSAIAPERQIPRAVDELVAQALAIEPARRPASMAAFAMAIHAARTASVVELPAAVAPAPRGRRAWLIGAAIACAAVGVGLAVVTASRDATPPQPSAGSRPAPAPEASVAATRRLTFDPGCEEFPAFLPDGRSVVFDADGSGNNDLYRLDVDTGTRQRLTQNPGWDYGVAVSPDGARLAYIHHDADAGMLYVLPVGGIESDARSLGPAIGMPVWTSNDEVVVGAPARDVVRWKLADGQPPERTVLGTAPPNYLPFVIAPLGDGRFWMLLRSNSETGRVALGELGTGAAIRVLDANLMDDEGWVAASPRGDGVYVTRRSKADTNELARTSRASPGALVTVPGGLSPRSGFTISPDGKRLVWSTCQAMTRLMVLTKDQPPRPLVPPGAWNDSYPVIVDARRVVFASTRTGRSEVWLLDRETGETRALTTDGATDPAVSPDGTLLAYTDTPSGAIVVVPLAGGAVRKLTHGPTDSSPAFSHDGTRVVFQRAVEAEGPRLFVVPLDASAPARAITPPGAQDPVTSPVDDRVVYMLRTADGTVPMTTTLDGAEPRRIAPDQPPGELWEPVIARDGKSVLLLRPSDMIELPLEDDGPPVVRWADPTLGVEAAAHDMDGTIVASIIVWDGDLWLADGEFP